LSTVRTDPARRRGALVALALATQLAGCQSMQTADMPEPSPENAVSLIGASSGGPQVPLKATPGLISVEIEVSWSNGAKDETLLGLEASPASELLVLAYERGRGFLPAASRLRRPAPARASSFDWTGALNYCGPCFALVILTAPIWLPIKAQANRSALRPSPDCCFVWIEDAKTGEIVAGSSPWQQAAIPAYTSTGAKGPSLPTDDLVNCVSEGVRKWVYQSSCD
jgi:hypothetical protein